MTSCSASSWVFPARTTTPRAPLVARFARSYVARDFSAYAGSLASRNAPCVHNGRIVAFYHDGAAFERANDGSWSPYQAVADVDALDHRSLACFGSVLLG